MADVQEFMHVIDDGVQNAISNECLRHQRAMANWRKFNANIAREVSEYLKTGIALHVDRDPSWENAGFTRDIGTPREFFAGVANQVKRPFLYAEMINGNIEMTMPMSGRLKPVAATLLLLSDELEEPKGGFTKWMLPYTVNNADRDVVRIAKGASWRFYFRCSHLSHQGKELFDQWRHMCADDRALRICLGVPPKP